MSTVGLWVYKLVTAWLPESRAFAWKRMWLRLAGAKIGKNVRIYSSARFLGNGRLEIGDDVHIGPEVMIYAVAPAGVTIGSSIDIGPRVTVLTGSHVIDPEGAHVAGKGTAAELPDLIYGDVASEIDGKVLSRTAHGEKFMPYGMPACHESMMYNMAIIRKLKLRYDTTYRISADYKFTYQFVNASTRFCYVKIVVVVYEEGGVSKVNKWKGLAEACRARKEVGGAFSAAALFHSNGANRGIVAVDLCGSVIPSDSTP